MSKSSTASRYREAIKIAWLLLLVPATDRTKLAHNFPVSNRQPTPSTCIPTVFNLEEIVTQSPRLNRPRVNLGKTSKNQSPTSKEVVAKLDFARWPRHPSWPRA